MRKQDYENEMRYLEQMKQMQAAKKEVAKVREQEDSKPWKYWLLIMIVASVACKITFWLGAVILLVYAFYLMYSFEQSDDSGFDV